MIHNLLSRNYPKVALIALLASAPLLAQEDARWYRVELLVFSRSTGATSEQWQATPALQYPAQARFLIDPQLQQANLQQHRADSSVDEFGRQILTLLPEETDSAASRELPAGQPQSNVQTPDQDQPVDSQGAEAEGPAVMLPTPFVILPASELEFGGKAAYMQRRSGTQTLFHRTWLQPVTDQGSALPIVLDRSGDSGQWPLLQGSIKLYLSRYLHIETNLWLNTGGEYLTGNWQMPAPPLGPSSLIIEELLPEQALPGDAPWPVGDVDTAYNQTTANVDDMFTAQNPNGIMPGLDPNDPALTGPQYPFRHAVLLQQKRRMRSNELHYIDHPMLGAVVKLTPLEAEELTALAQQETTGK